MTRQRGLLDTSVFIARESGRPADLGAAPDELAVSIVTIGELWAGVLAAPDTATRAQRMRTASDAATVATVEIGVEVARAWAQLRVALRDAGRRMKVNDSWIAATALAHDVAVVTQDGDFDDVPGLSVIHV
ncbi:type II toxin-antitoxin system VapC family toxin [Angustibacter sp. McL0619]|uniref:type II toxin-antitoxin system VapC family toxin n=1 Tax=Angustibacter sp. McL0619 TaxID=3415676 RepID=UPI003CFB2B60